MLDGSNGERPDVEEQYQTAGNTSNLTVEADRKGAGDVIISAGWSPSRVGMALLRLHSEWDSAAKPRKPGKGMLEAMAAAIRAEDAQAKEARDKANGELARLRAVQAKAPTFDRLVEIGQLKSLYAKKALPLPDVARGQVQVRAQQRAKQWYDAELRLLAQSLKSRAVVWEQLEHWRALKGVDPDTVAEALLHWLDPTCPVCEGHGLRKVPGQPALGARQCHACDGGHKRRPKGTAVVLNYFDDCCQKARTSLKNRLRNG